MCFTGTVDGASHPTEYGLTELAERSGVPPRTIRYYQSEGAAPEARAGEAATPSTTPSTATGCGSSPSCRTGA